MKISFFESDNITDSIMGLDAILSSGGTQAIRDFMEYHNIEALLKKSIDFYSENIRMVLVVQ